MLKPIFQLIGFLVVILMFCLTLAGCGASKPSASQIKSDAKQTVEDAFQIDQVTIQSEQGDDEDYYAKVNLKGKQDIFEVKTDISLKYRKNGKIWELVDASNPARYMSAHISRCPTEQEIMGGFSILQAVDTYIPYENCTVLQDETDFSDATYRMSLQSQFDNISVSNIELNEDNGAPTITFDVSYTETYSGVTATVENRKMSYVYYPENSMWNIWGETPVCVALDYSGLKGRRIGNEYVDGYIEDISTEGMTIVINDKKTGYTGSYEYVLPSEQESIASQYINMWYRGSILGYNSIGYDSTSSIHGAWLNIGEQTISRDWVGSYESRPMNIYE